MPRPSKLTKTAMRKLIQIAATADGGRQYCVGGILEGLDTAFPGLDWEGASRRWAKSYKPVPPAEQDYSVPDWCYADPAPVLQHWDCIRREKGED